MALESGDYIADLTQTNPAGTDQLKTADDHLRLLKKVLVQTFPNMDAGTSVSAANLNAIKGLTVTAGVINRLNGWLSGSGTQLNHIDGLTAGVQSQINALINGKLGLSAQASVDMDSFALSRVGHVAFASEFTSTGSLQCVVNFRLGQKQRVLLRDRSCSLSLIGAGVSNYLIAFENITASSSVKFATTIKWLGGTRPTFTNSSNAENLVGLYYSGGTWYGQGGSFG